MNKRQRSPQEQEQDKMTVLLSFIKETSDGRYTVRDQK